jgi:hypothetical protein
MRRDALAYFLLDLSLSRHPGSHGARLVDDVMSGYPSTFFIIYLLGLGRLPGSGIPFAAFFFAAAFFLAGAFLRGRLPGSGIPFAAFFFAGVFFLATFFPALFLLGTAFADTM